MKKIRLCIAFLTVFAFSVNAQEETTLQPKI